MITIETKEIGDYKIEVGYDVDCESPNCSCDFVGYYIWQYMRMDNKGSVDGDWRAVCAHKGDLSEIIRTIFCDRIGFTELIPYIQQGELDLWSIVRVEDSYEVRFSECDYPICVFYEGEIEKGFDRTRELSQLFSDRQMIRMLNDLDDDIVIQYWYAIGHDQGDCVHGISFCTKERYTHMVDNNTTNWKSKVKLNFQAENKKIEMWLWGDVLRCKVYKKVWFTKKYDELTRPDERVMEYEEIEDLYELYMPIDEAIQYAIVECNIKE